MPFQTKALIPYLETVLTGLPGMQHVQRGEPADPPTNVNAFVLVGGQQTTRKATGGQFQRVGRYVVEFVLRVAGEEDDAEDVLADLIDAWELAILSDPTCGGLTTNLELNTAPADNPDYRRLYGPEYRVWPCEVVVTQTVRIP
jgi:hypothetical protein